jgi:hypothetical protein
VKEYKHEQSRALKKTRIPMIYVTKIINHLLKDVVIVGRATVSILGKLGPGLRQGIFHFIEIINCSFTAIILSLGTFY